MLLVLSYFSRIKGYFHRIKVKSQTLDKLKYFDLAGGEQFEDPGFTYPTISQLQEIEDGNYDFEVKSCVKLMDSKTLSKKVAKLQSDMGYLKQLYFKKQYLEQLKEK